MKISDPLFVSQKTVWNDDRMVGGSVEKTDVRYHDKERTLLILNGLCADIFFRAEDIQAPWFKDIPDAAVPMLSFQIPVHQKFHHEKPLDSKYLNRTYILSPNIQDSSLKTKKGKRRRR